MARTMNLSDDPDDIFADTRMSFGDHIEELRSRLIKALIGLVICLFAGFILDAIGQGAGWPNFGVGRPMLRIIVDPVESQVRDFYAMRTEKSRKRLSEERADPVRVEEIRKKLASYDGSLLALTQEERDILRGSPREMPVILPTEPLAKALGLPPPAVKEVELTAQVYPTHINYLTGVGEGLLETKQYMTTLSVQEAFVVYFKVSLLCGVVLASPWIFFQLWAFVAAGLYPHEKKYIHLYLPVSVILFLTGVVLCQFIVLPGAVRALLAFNNWIDLDPDLRLNEWLGFALLLPVVFGVSFQTPLVMLFLNRLGMFTYADYWAKWRYAVFVLAFFSALITPTPDAVTMLYLFVPMFGLYMLGILVCYLFPSSHEAVWDEANEEVAV
jgi:sec-independent protein translocase protein TatC